MYDNILQLICFNTHDLTLNPIDLFLRSCNIFEFNEDIWTTTYGHRPYVFVTAIARYIIFITRTSQCEHVVTSTACAQKRDTSAASGVSSDGFRICQRAFKLMLGISDDTLRKVMRERLGCCTEEFEDRGGKT